MGGFGILEDFKLEHVPGTALLNDESQPTHAAGLKHGTGKYSHIVLVPQPSEDPNDPLNWPLWQKDLCLVTTLFGTLLFPAVLVPILSPATYAMSVEFGTTLTAIAQLTGYCLLCVGSFGIFVSAMSRLWGKRPQFLLASLLGIIGTLVGECAQNYNTILAARLLQGFSVAAYESLIVAFVGDMYFIHQRGSRVTLFQLVSNTIAVLAPIISGVIYTHLGWRYIFHIAQPFLCLQLILAFFFLPETAYNRSSIYNTDTASTENVLELEEVNRAKRAESQVENLEADAQELPGLKTWVQRLAIYNGRFTKTNPFKLILGPFVVLLNPATLWGCLTQGISSAWWVATSFVLAQIWGVAPYNLDAAAVGYLYTGPFIGGTLGVIFMVMTSDPLCRWVARKNGGIYEPEFRIYPIVIAVVTGAIGLFLFGSMIDAGKGYYVGSVLHGIYGFSVNVAGAVMNAYVVDAYREESTEMLIMAMIFKNFFFYSLSYYVNNWLARVGPTRYFDVQGAVVMGIYATSIPMYLFGKRVRSWWRRRDFIRRLGGMPR